MPRTRRWLEPAPLPPRALGLGKGWSWTAWGFIAMEGATHRRAGRRSRRSQIINIIKCLGEEHDDPPYDGCVQGLSLNVHTLFALKVYEYLGQNGCSYGVYEQHLRDVFIRVYEQRMNVHTQALAV